VQCTSCGEEVPAWAASCPHCGAAVSTHQQGHPEGGARGRDNPGGGWAPPENWPLPGGDASPPDGYPGAGYGAPPPPGYGAPPGAYGNPGYGGLPPGGYFGSYGEPGGGWGPAPALAGWWYRVGATVIDGIILGIIDAIITGGPGFGTRSASTVGVGLIIGVAYQTALLGTRGQTVGNMALHTRVVDAGTGGPIGYWRAALHYLVEYVLFVLVLIPGILDVLWPLWDRRRHQTLHDKAVSTVVVRVP
jgi:uncharacterized RDD family membrane protein YckC